MGYRYNSTGGDSTTGYCAVWFAIRLYCRVRHVEALRFRSWEGGKGPVRIVSTIRRPAAGFPRGGCATPPGRGDDLGTVPPRRRAALGGSNGGSWLGRVRPEGIPSRRRDRGVGVCGEGSLDDIRVCPRRHRRLGHCGGQSGGREEVAVAPSVRLGRPRLAGRAVRPGGGVIHQGLVLSTFPLPSPGFQLRHEGSQSHVILGGHAVSLRLVDGI